MRLQYTKKILASSVKRFCLIFSLILIAYYHNSIQTVCADDSQDVFETIKFKDSDGLDHEEYQFKPLTKGYPSQIIKMYCANVKLRLYWGVFREEVKSTLRTGMHLRRLARFTRHLFEDIRGVDDPFDGKRLSVIDKWYGVKLTKEDENDLNNANKDAVSTTHSTVDKVKGLVKKYAPTVIVGLYTRWRTMWWLMMSCLFAKYYLWDPALDDFVKLQRSMVMYPEFQLVRLEDIDCLSIKFFKRLLDTCKVLNPLMNFDFGQLNLDKTWQFKMDKTE